ncbi:hypothetical protein KKB83_02205 [Patescibacteria group bacterium]|nr:hypothetical protein [Patescibacteria group bacterium]
MRKRIIRIGIFIIITMGVLFVLRFVVGGPEDSWICVDEQWVKHGFPSYPKPETGCEELH